MTGTLHRAALRPPTPQDESTQDLKQARENPVNLYRTLWMDGHTLIISTD